MDFVGAIQSGFRNYVNFKGVAKRSEYWYWVLFSVLAAITAAAIDKLTGIAILGSFVSFGTMLPNLSMSVRRLRDAGKSWIWLLSTLPGLVLAFAGLVTVAFNLYDLGYITTSAELDDPNFPSQDLIQRIIEDSRFYPGFGLILVGLAISAVFSLITNLIFMLLPSKILEQRN